jgi:hypothetical protein
VGEIEGMTGVAIRQQFNEARTKDFHELGGSLRTFFEENKKARGEAFESDLEKLRRRYLEIREIDYFDSPSGQDVQMLLQKADSLHRKGRRKPSVLHTGDYQKQIWLTRPQPGIDRVASAWLIRKWIDPGARFAFAATPSDKPSAIPFDMANVEFTHHLDNCTFETLLDRFSISDAALKKIGEMVHDADLEDGKFQRFEAIGLERVFNGWAKLGIPDEEILVRGGDCFDALYADLKK